MFAAYILGIRGNRGSEAACGKDADLKLRPKSDAGAQEGPEIWVGLCYGASNCKDDEAGGCSPVLSRIWSGLVAKDTCGLENPSLQLSIKWINRKENLPKVF